jgi:hypothetical protein
MTSFSHADLIHANVNPYTGLATDYLNLFNEAIMLFEMALDMPDLAEDLADWKRRTYVEHFEKSGFESKDVVIWAYHNAAKDIRQDFDACTEQAINLFDSSIAIILISNLEDPEALLDLSERLAGMKALVVEMDAHIHGKIDPAKPHAQSEVDALF